MESFSTNSRHFVGQSSQLPSTSVNNTKDNDSSDPLLMLSMRCSYKELIHNLCQIDFSKERNTSTTTTTTTTNQCNNNSNVERIFKTADEEKEITSSLFLPMELIIRIIQFLIAERIEPDQVLAIGCSSHDGVHPLSSCLRDDETSWWLSAPGTMRTGSAPGNKEYVEFQLIPNENSMCRLRSVSIKIPPLPQGPLSVCLFHLELLKSKKNRLTTTTTSHIITTTTSITYDNNDYNDDVHPNCSNALKDNSRNSSSKSDDCYDDADDDWHIMTPSYEVENRTGWQTFNLITPIDLSPPFVRMVCTANQMDRLTLQIQPLDDFSAVGFFAIRFE